MRGIQLVIMIIGMILLVACGENQGTTNSNLGNGDSDEGYKDEIKVGLDFDADAIDPRLQENDTSARSTELIFEGLVYKDEELVPQPALAKDWEIVDDTTYIFNLREDVKFHDGEVLTSEDVKYTFDKILDENFESVQRSNYQIIEQIEIIDEFTIQFDLRKPFSPFLAFMHIGIVPKHLGDNEDFSSNPVGTGPYKFVNWDRNSKIEFEVNRDYWGQSPETDKIVYYIIPDDSSRIAAFESGDVDLIHSPLPPQDVVRLESKDGVTIKTIDEPDFTQINFNVKDEILSDINVRKAIAHLVNRESIVNDVYEGIGMEGAPLLAPLSWDKDVIEYIPYNPEEAIKLLNESGWVDTNEDGFLEKNGEILSISLTGEAANAARMQILEILQYDLTNVGIDAKLEPLEPGTFFPEMVNHKFQVGLIGASVNHDPHYALNFTFHSEGGINYGQYNNSEVDRLIEAGAETVDDSERLKLYGEAVQKAVDDVAFTMAVGTGYTAIYDSDLEGFVPHPGRNLKTLASSKLKK